MSIKSDIALSGHIKAITQIFLFGFLLIVVNSIWDQWLSHGGYLFFFEVIIFCVVIVVRGRLSKSRNRLA